MESRRRFGAGRCLPLAMLFWVGPLACGTCAPPPPPPEPDAGATLEAPDAGPLRPDGGTPDAGDAGDAGFVALACAGSCGREVLGGHPVLCGQCQPTQTCVFTDDGGASGGCAGLPFGPACSLDGICSDTERTPLADFTRVWGSAPDDVWAVADQGRIWHFDGSEWSAALALSEAALLDLHGSSASNVWLVGAKGTVARFDGVKWTELAGPELADLVAVFVAAADEVFVASAGRVWKWNGQRWQLELQLSGTEASVADLEGAGAEDLWLSSNAGVRHRTAAGWGALLVPDDHRPCHWLALAPAGQLLVSSPGALLSYDGQSWSTELLPCTGVGRVAATPDAVWQLTSACVAHREGNGPWTVWRPELYGGSYFTGLWFAPGTNDGWMVGYGGRLARVLAGQPSLWSPYPPFWQGDVDGTSAENLWAIDAPYGGLLRRQEGRWRRVALPEGLDAGITALRVLGPSSVWLVAGDKAAEFDGARFTRMTTMRAPFARSLSGSSSKSLWASGGVGADSAQRFDGVQWSEVPLQSDAGRWVYRVQQTSSGEVYALTGSELWRFADGGFVLERDFAEDAGAPYLSDVAAAGDSLWLTYSGVTRQGPAGPSLWIEGGVLQRADAGWSRPYVSTADVEQLLAVEAVAPADVWLLGHRTLHWNGARVERPVRGGQSAWAFTYGAAAVDGGLYMVGAFPGVRVRYPLPP